MKINWKVRLRNKKWLGMLASQTAILVQAVLAGLVGLDVIHIDLGAVDQDIKIILGLVDVVLIYFSFLGLIVDPTTDGVSDSGQAMRYAKPREVMKK